MQQLAFLCERWELMGYELGSAASAGASYLHSCRRTLPPCHGAACHIDTIFLPIASDDQLLDDILHEQQRQAGDGGSTPPQPAYVTLTPMRRSRRAGPERVPRCRYPVYRDLCPALLPGSPRPSPHIDQVKKYRKAISPAVAETDRRFPG